MKKRTKAGQSTGGPNSGVLSLETQVKLWPTPRASEYKGVGPLGSKSHEHRLNRKYLDATVQEAEQLTGALNPAWVCWLMGWPLGWDSLEPLPADSMDFHYSLMETGKWWVYEPPIPRIGKDIPKRCARLKALGNGMVPLCFVTAFNELTR